MKRIFVKEEWCLGCHLCEYNCAFANGNEQDIILACKGKTIHPRIRIEDGDGVHFAVNCRECENPLCMLSCISGAITKNGDLVQIDENKCVQCHSCIMACPYGALSISENHVMQKCELCVKKNIDTPPCVAGCPNRAIVFEER